MYLFIVNAKSAIDSNNSNNDDEKKNPNPNCSCMGSKCVVMWYIKTVSNDVLSCKLIEGNLI